MRAIKGFPVEVESVHDARDVAQFGGWRSALQHLAQPDMQHARPDAQNHV